MLVPDKYTELRYSVISVAAAILRHTKGRYVKLDKLTDDVIAEVGEDARFNFFNALSFLYMIGKIDYNVRRDSVKRGGGKIENQ